MMTTTGYQLLNNPFLNKGTAFTEKEREQYNLIGLLPSQVQTLEQQTKQAYKQFKSKQTPLEKRLLQQLMKLFLAELM